MFSASKSAGRRSKVDMDFVILTSDEFAEYEEENCDKLRKSKEINKF